MTSEVEESLTASNIISCLRAPLALCFLIDNVGVRLASVLLALFSDGLDGYLARRNRSVTQLGALLDPVMDKFFVLFTGSILLAEGSLHPSELVAMISRDFAVAFFGFYLVFTGRLGRTQFRSIWSGKISTLLQFSVLIALSLHLVVPPVVYGSFVVLAGFALLELFITHGLRAGHSQV